MPTGGGIALPHVWRSCSRRGRWKFTNLESLNSLARSWTETASISGTVLVKFVSFVSCDVILLSVYDMYCIVSFAKTNFLFNITLLKSSRGVVRWGEFWIWTSLKCSFEDFYHITHKAHLILYTLYQSIVFAHMIFYFYFFTFSVNFYKKQNLHTQYSLQIITLHSLFE